MKKDKNKDNANSKRMKQRNHAIRCSIKKTNGHMKHINLADKALNN